MNAFVHRNPSIEMIDSYVTASPRSAFRRFVDAWKQRRAESAEQSARLAADRQFWDAALADPRLMAEIRRAQSQSDIQP